MYSQLPFQEDFAFIVFTAFIFLYFFSYDNLPYSLCFILKMIFKPLIPATFIDNKMEAYLSLPFETQEGFVKCDVFFKKKPTNQLYWFGKDSLLHL